MPKEIIRAWYFRSSSGDKLHETLAWVEDRRAPMNLASGAVGTRLVREITLTCNCAGWTKRCNDGKRTCKHVRRVMADPALAGGQAVTMKDFGTSINELRMIQEMGRKTTLRDYPEQPFYTEKPKPKPERRKPNAASNDASSRLFNFGDEP
jgi:hypothetical protein